MIFNVAMFSIGSYSVGYAQQLSRITHFPWEVPKGSAYTRECVSGHASPAIAHKPKKAIGETK
jgi:hypothetical protein